MWQQLALFSVLVALAGCASGARPAAPSAAAGAPSASTTTAPRRSQSAILEDEIAENPGITNAYDLIVRLRPNYLRTPPVIAGAPGIGIRVDAGPQREMSDLRNIDVRQIREIRYYSPLEANVRFGIDTNIPVIAVTLKRLP